MILSELCDELSLGYPIDIFHGGPGEMIADVVIRVRGSAKESIPTRQRDHAVVITRICHNHMMENTFD